MIVKELSFVIVNFAYTFLIAFSFYIFGRPILSAIKFKSLCIIKRLLVSSILGCIILANFIFLLGIFGIINKYILIVAFIFFTFLSRNYLKEDLTEFIKVDKETKIFLFMMVLALLPIFITTLYPPFRGDEISYHLATVKQYIETHAITPTIYLRYAVFPRNMEMLFLFPMLFFKDISSHFVSFLSLFYTSIALYAFCKTYYTKKAGLISAGLLISNPIILWLSGVGYIDAGLMLFVTISILSLLEWIRTMDDKWLIILSVTIGFAAGIKYSALFFVILIFIVVVYKSILNKRYKTMALFIVLSILSLLPWYAFNYYYTGNPVWPFFSKIFGITIWDANDIRSQLTDLLRAHAGSKTLMSFLQLPWNLIFKNWREYQFLTEVPSPLSLIFIFLSSISYIIAVFKKDNTIRILALIGFLYTVFWFFTAPLIRYLVPAIPILCAVSGVLLAELVEKIKINNKFVIITLFFLVALQGENYALNSIKVNGLPPVTIKQRQKFLENHLAAYKGFKFLNRRINKTDTVYSLFYGNMAYYSKGKFIGDWFGPARYGNMFNALSSKNKTCKILDKLKANYFLIDMNSLKYRLQAGYEKILLWEKQDNGCLSAIYKDGNTVIFKVE